jgi:hypothetical protein
MDEPSPGHIPVLLLIDVEPDEFFVDRATPGRWPGFERGVLWTSALRTRLATAGRPPPRFNWGFRLDSQIRDTWGRADWVLAHYRECVDEFRLHGDALGVHTHLYRWSGRPAGWLIDQADPEWVLENLALSVGSFADALGRDPAFFRFGDRWMSEEALAWLDGAGVPFDLSLEPGMPALPTLHRGHPSTGSIPHQRGVPDGPYRPSRDDFRKPDTTGRTRIVEIPTTTGRMRPPRALTEDPRPRNAWAWLRYRTRPWFEVAALYQEPERLHALVDDALARGAPYLSMTMRVDTFSKSPATGHLERAFDALLSHPAADRFVWTTPEDLVRQVAPGLLPAAPQPGGRIQAATPAGASSSVPMIRRHSGGRRPRSDTASGE